MQKFSISELEMALIGLFLWLKDLMFSFIFLSQARARRVFYDGGCKVQMR